MSSEEAKIEVVEKKDTEPTTTEEPEAKKQKIADDEEEKKSEEKTDEEKKTDEMTPTEETTKTSTGTYPMSPDSEWPEAWYMMEDGTYTDQKALNRLEPNKPATVELLKELGIAYWKMDAENFTYPAKAIPWDPKDATDPKLKAIRDAREYNDCGRVWCSA